MTIFLWMLMRPGWLFKSGIWFKNLNLKIVTSFLMSVRRFNTTPGVFWLALTLWARISCIFLPTCALGTRIHQNPHVSKVPRLQYFDLQRDSTVQKAAKTQVLNFQEKRRDKAKSSKTNVLTDRQCWVLSYRKILERWKTWYSTEATIVVSDFLYAQIFSHTTVPLSQSKKRFSTTFLPWIREHCNVTEWLTAQRCIIFRKSIFGAYLKFARLKTSKNSTPHVWAFSRKFSQKSVLLYPWFLAFLSILRFFCTFVPFRYALLIGILFCFCEKSDFFDLWEMRMSEKISVF